MLTKRNASHWHREAFHILQTHVHTYFLIHNPRSNPKGLHTGTPSKNATLHASFNRWASRSIRQVFSAGSQEVDKGGGRYQPTGIPWAPPPRPLPCVGPCFLLMYTWKTWKANWLATVTKIPRLSFSLLCLATACATS